MSDNPRSEIPTSGRLAGIDFGLSRIGIAICDPGQQFSSPLEIYHSRSEKLDDEFFLKLVKRESLVGFVVGLPVHMSGDESEMSQAARQFGERIGELTGLPVGFVDERYTTAMAREILSGSNLSGKKRKAQLDKLAAQILLATFLENRTRANPFGELG